MKEKRLPPSQPILTNTTSFDTCNVNSQKINHGDDRKMDLSTTHTHLVRSPQPPRMNMSLTARKQRILLRRQSLQLESSVYSNSKSDFHEGGLTNNTMSSPKLFQSVNDWKILPQEHPKESKSGMSVFPSSQESYATASCTRSVSIQPLDTHFHRSQSSARLSYASAKSNLSNHHPTSSIDAPAGTNQTDNLLSPNKSAQHTIVSSDHATTNPIPSQKSQHSYKEPNASSNGTWAFVTSPVPPPPSTRYMHSPPSSLFGTVMFLSNDLNKSINKKEQQDHRNMKGAGRMGDGNDEATSHVPPHAQHNHVVLPLYPTDRSQEPALSTPSRNHTNHLSSHLTPITNIPSKPSSSSEQLCSTPSQRLDRKGLQDGGDNKDFETPQRSTIKSHVKMSKNISLGVTTPNLYRPTPQRSCPFPGTSASPLSKHSPGGYALLKVLENLKADASNFITDPPVTEQAANDTCLSRRDEKQEESLEDWYEACISLPYWNHSMRLSTHLNPQGHMETSYTTSSPQTGGTKQVGRSVGEVGFMDWTLKRSLHLECHPRSCLPGSILSFSQRTKKDTFVGFTNDSNIDMLAMHIFLNAGCVNHGDFVDPSSITSEEVALAQWRASLMYWQHPQNHPFPNQLLADTKPMHSSLMPLHSSSSKVMDMNTEHKRRASFIDPSTAEGLKKSVSNSTDVDSVNLQAHSILNSVQGSHDILQKRVRLAGVGSLGGLGLSTCSEPESSTVARLISQREREWKECFRSMFFTWMNKTMTMKSSPTEDYETFFYRVSRLSFYAIRPGQVILFKAKPSSDAEERNESRMSADPMIILSSSTFECRQKLQSMGVELKLFENDMSNTTNNDVAVSENLIEDWMRKGFIIDNSEDAHILQEELLNLENATSHGLTVGPEVSVNATRKVKHIGPSGQLERKFPPLFLTGFDNCMSFFEYYWNTLGGQITGQDVPLLICRSVGPCLHTTLRSLTISSKRVGWKPPDHKSSSSSSERHSSITLNGPIMPCAVRDILCATVITSLLNKGTDLGRNDHEASRDNEPVGSHYFVCTLRGHEGESQLESVQLSTKNKRIGSSGSLLFNDGLSNAETSIHQCRGGELVNTVVWDISRPSSIVCERDHVLV